jgi:LysW-gamma-L-alpha-aminoadipyl-6-phosphate/LysW-L-glutamyl-5-phosphate reductase
MNETRNAVIFGAGGFAGGELLRLLACHPKFEIKAALSNTQAQKRIAEVYPNLAPWTDAVFTAPNNFDFSEMKRGGWTLFAALGHKETQSKLAPLVRDFEDADVNIVDLSGDFRLDDAAIYETYYKTPHTAPALLETFVYGLPELNRAAIKKATRVANPGCFATASELAVLPMAAADIAVRFIAVDAKTGSSGGGIIPAETTHHPNRMNNFSAYKQFDHQHFPEIRGGWISAGGSPDTEISFVPQRAPMVRGIFVTAHFFLDRPVDTAFAEALYKTYYEPHPFVRIVKKSPFVSNVWGANMCDISVAAKGRSVVVCSVIDNLIKGAAGQAVQNANLMQGFDETEGLIYPAPMPV